MIQENSAVRVPGSDAKSNVVPVLERTSTIGVVHKVQLSLRLTKYHAMRMYGEWRYSSTHS
jgi:hypothetical protein